MMVVSSRLLIRRAVRRSFAAIHVLGHFPRAEPSTTKRRDRKTIDRRHSESFGSIQRRRYGNNAMLWLPILEPGNKIMLALSDASSRGSRRGTLGKVYRCLGAEVMSGLISMPFTRRPGSPHHCVPEGLRLYYIASLGNVHSLLSSIHNVLSIGISNLDTVT